MAYSTKNCIVNEKEAQRQRHLELIKRACELLKKQWKKKEMEEKKIDNFERFVLGTYMKKDSP